jgi:hypothetical protein
VGYNVNFILLINKTEVIKVISLHIYPIKGMMGLSVNSATALERGFEHDRRYMLIDEYGTFISQRTHPNLVFFRPEILGDDLIVHFKTESKQVPLSASLGNTVNTTIFDNLVKATEVSEEMNLWFSFLLNQKVRLVKMSAHDIRYKELIKGPKEVEVSFADGYPYLITGTGSFDHLNTLLKESIDYNRFRANIIVETTEPHIEDSWDEITIGNVNFHVIKPCARCQVVTVDQSSGLKSKEPLKTLSTYRKKDNKIYFGANAICLKDGRIGIGDEVVFL